MPIPKPNESETESEFISRCVPLISSEYPQDQALAVCYSQFSRKAVEQVPGTTVFKELWKDYSTDNFKIYLVDGAQTTVVDPDFNQGGNWLAHDGVRTKLKVPSNEIWVELFGYLIRMKRWLLHETTETLGLLKRYSELGHEPTLEERQQIYDSCHEIANSVENMALTKPEMAEELLTKAITELSDYMSKPVKSKETTMFAVKFIDEEKGIIEGLGIPYGGPVRENEKDLGKDLQGEYFTAKTDFISEKYDGKAIKGLPLKYHHGLDPEVKDEDIGEVTEVQDRPEGKWFTAQLNKAYKYYEGIKELVKRGILKFSSGAIREGVKRADDGFISRWPLKELSTTPLPANPLAEINSFKSLMEVNIMENKTDKASTKAFEKPEGSPEIKPGDPTTPPGSSAIVTMEKPKDSPAIEANTNGYSGPEAAKPPTETPVKADVCPKCGKSMTECKCGKSLNAGKAVQLPPEVVQALNALDQSIHEILEGQQADEKPEEKPAPAGDKPAAPFQPGVNQGMAPETHAKAEVKSEIKSTEDATKTILVDIESKLKEAVKGAVTPLIERIERLESLPATNGPRKSAVKSTDNPKIAETEVSSKDKQAALDEIARDISLSGPIREAAARKSAELSMTDVIAQGPQRRG